MQHTWAQRIIDFYNSLRPPVRLPNGIIWLYPQQQPQVQQVMQAFFQKFYNDTAPRKLILGINPGRFGAGVTGVNFTAAKQLINECGIDCNLPLQSELSAEFIYKMIGAYGGPQHFYSHYFIGSVCPLGFVQGGKNINYYDDKALLQTVQPFIANSLSSLLQMPFNTDKIFCIGGEKNYKYLAKLNVEYKWAKEIIPLPHPRFVMQYRRRFVDAYVADYLQALTQ